MKYHPYLSDMNDENTAELDATGLLCPLPVLKARKRLQGLSPGDTLKILADDPAAVIDVPHFCHEAGHELISAADSGTVQTYVIRKKA
ncbi:sulfurtransferase TusA family protein [Roseobacter sp. S98]|uniref:sulfurtransferase TusA family protein n=1 Tax=Roseobacter algicola (ex Choi et al. 2025) (nom. illeg.) TaxID=3092138 RepID=UPI0035C76725